MQVDQNRLAELVANIKRDSEEVNRLLENMSPEERTRQLNELGLISPQQNEQVMVEQEEPRQK